MAKNNLRTIFATALAVVVMSAMVVVGATNTYTYSSAFTLEPGHTWISSQKSFEKATHKMSVVFQKTYAEGDIEFGIYSKLLGTYFPKATHEMNITKAYGGIEYFVTLGEVSRGTRYYKFNAYDTAHYKVASFTDEW